eukprot:8340194-Ditylum_brightwellii.AAC.1
MSPFPLRYKDQRIVDIPKTTTTTAATTTDMHVTVTMVDLLPDEIESTVIIATVKDHVIQILKAMSQMIRIRRVRIKRVIGCNSPPPQ